jgi:ribosomal protein S18 acetylase RimI-like enzyme
MTASVEIHRAGPDQAPIVAATLADAFIDDPVMTWLLPQTVCTRSGRLRRFYAAELKAYARRSKPVYLAADGRGAAMWSPPKTHAPTTGDSLRETLPMIAIFRGGIIRASQVGTQLGGLHPKTPPHWYLYMLGTRTDSQSQGIGTAMLRLGLDAVDADHAPAYLESSNRRNVSLYERHGFEVMQEIRLAGGGPPMWPMWREPVA